MVRPRLPGRYERRTGTEPLGRAAPLIEVDAELSMAFPRERAPAGRERRVQGVTPATSEATPSAENKALARARGDAPRPAEGDADVPARDDTSGRMGRDRQPPASPRVAPEPVPDRRPPQAVEPRPADEWRPAPETRPGRVDPGAAIAGNALETRTRDAVARPKGEPRAVRAPGDLIAREPANQEAVRPVLRPRTQGTAADRAASTVITAPASGPAPPGTGVTRQVRPAVEPAVPHVQVTIGRVEVRAVYSPPPAPAPSRPRPGPAMALEDYLKQREGGS